MPKILESMREQLLETAKRQLLQNGYQRMTVRSVAAECGIAVGTVYNYFPSKDALIAAFVSGDWQNCVASIAAHTDDDARTRFLRIYETLRAFTETYRPLFSDEGAAKVRHAAFLQRHMQLRGQIAALIAPVCGGEAFLPEFLAEALLVWTAEDKPFEPIWQIIQKLIVQGGIKE